MKLVADMSVNFDAQKAIEIATKFLDQYHSSIDLKSAKLEGKVWVIKFDVGFLSSEIREVRVDAESGKVLGYT